MNLLQLAQRLSSECGVTNTPMTTTANQTGTNGKLVGWIKSAWLEIQGMHDNWNWMREPFQFETVANVGDYVPTDITNVLTGDAFTDLRYWWRDTFRCQKKSIGIQDEQWLVEWEYLVFRNTYRFNVQVPGRPVVFAIRPNAKAVLFGQIPDDVYVITGEYQVLPSDLNDDTDIPAMPEHLHMAIVYKAMQSYGLYESAPEVLSRGNTEFSRLMNQLEREQLPEVYLGNPLA